jgi:hypothetical protein
MAGFKSVTPTRVPPHPERPRKWVVRGLVLVLTFLASLVTLVAFDVARSSRTVRPVGGTPNPYVPS